MSEPTEYEFNLEGMLRALRSELAAKEARIADIESNVVYIIWDSWENSCSFVSKAKFDKANAENRWKLCNAEALANKPNKEVKNYATKQ
jgi:hypothetical protein